MESPCKIQGIGVAIKQEPEVFIDYSYDELPTWQSAEGTQQPVELPDCGELSPKGETREYYEDSEGKPYLRIPANKSRILRLSRMAQTFTTDSLAGVVEQLGLSFTNCVIPKNGIAYIEFATPKDASNACCVLKASTHLLPTRDVGPLPSGQYGCLHHLPRLQRPKGCVHVFISQIPHSCGNYDIHEHFRECGTIRSIAWVYASDSISPNPFKRRGVIEFTTENEAATAVNSMNGSILLGNAINVNYMITGAYRRKFDLSDRLKHATSSVEWRSYTRMDYDRETAAFTAPKQESPRYCNSNSRSLASKSQRYPNDRKKEAQERTPSVVAQHLPAFMQALEKTPPTGMPVASANPIAPAPLAFSVTPTTSVATTADPAAETNWVLRMLDYYQMPNLHSLYQQQQQQLYQQEWAKWQAHQLVYQVQQQLLALQQQQQQPIHYLPASSIWASVSQ